MKQKIQALRQKISGDVFDSSLYKTIYATDASVYKEEPLLVVLPKNNTDIQTVIEFARTEKIPIIPRGAGTSLCGQVVGKGLILDISKYMNSISNLDVENKQVTVQPGVVLDELNKYLEKYGLFFGPETSTANRCVMGGMLGNNSCGSHSIVYGSTRDHVHSLKVFLSNGEEAFFAPLTPNELNEKCKGNNLENQIYRNITQILSHPTNQNQIREHFPHPDIKRRNTGYALDILLETEPFAFNGKAFNISKLIAGSEGTLAIATQITLNLVPLPPACKGVVAAHFHSLEEAFEANLIALRHLPEAVELIDKHILDCTKESIEHRQNRFFIEGDPAALLVIEFSRQTMQEIENLADAIRTDMTKAGYGYHFPLITGTDINRVWSLRKAGLGLLANIAGDSKAVTLIEDTAVRPSDLPQYMADFVKILEKHQLSCVFHAHIGSGELHLRPVLNLKDAAQVQLFHNLGVEIAQLVKKYRGSLSGEHGDGRLRTEFIPLILGEHNYRLIKQIKQTFDPENIFNPNKISDAPPMTSHLRNIPDVLTRQVETIFDFSTEMGIVRAVEKCNGSGDCRKSAIIGGTMCPSFMASRDERNTTRARANTLREILNNSTNSNPFNDNDLYDIMDLCLSCKGCKAECPSGVDMAKLKAEFLQHFYDSRGVPLRSKMIANIAKINQLGSWFPAITNFVMRNGFTSSLLKKTLGFAPQRQMPLLSNITLKQWNRKNNLPKNEGKTVYLFADEFTNFNDSHIGIKTILLLTCLGYSVIVPEHYESARTYISKGLLRKAKKIANKNVATLSTLISAATPLVGIEPSAILSFRDEYPELVDKNLKTKAIELSKNVKTIEEFLWNEMKTGQIAKERFSREAKQIRYHGHCQQKAIASVKDALGVLSFPENYEATEIKSGCCGMAGSFGYEKEHYHLSMKIGELVLFPAIRTTAAETLISASGTSCRHQIADGTERKALHPVEILYDALII